MLGIVIGLILLMFLAMKGLTILVVGPLCALFVAATGGINLLQAYTKTYMTGAAGYFSSWFPTFLLGALFGKIMDDSGAAEAVAHLIVQKLGKERAIIAVIAACAVLTYGGISLFVVVFTMYPLAMALFKEADLPKRLIPGCIALGSFTFTMTAIPGTPQIQNLIPTKYFGTTPTAAPVMGIIAAIIMAVAGTYYMQRRAKNAKEKGEKFVPGEKDERYLQKKSNGNNTVNPYLALVPLLAVILLLNLFKWDIVIALAAGILLCAALFWRRMANPLQTFNQGAQGSMLAILNTACAVGFGTVVKAVPGFNDLVKVVTGLSGGNGLIADVVAVNLLAGATGSASGGMSIALEAMSKMLLATGANPAALHRVASVASGGLDTLPHNGAVLTLLAVCGLTHKDSYVDIMWVSLIIPVLTSLVCALLGTIGII